MPIKELITYYRCYKIYKITFINGSTLYNGVSDYTREGFITISGDSEEEVIQSINNVYKRMQILQMNKRMR